jgi:hypothetical protein
VAAPKWLTALGISEECLSKKGSAKEGRCRFSIRLHPGDKLWRVKVDGCWLSSTDGKKVDYMFWAETAAGKKLIFLVELKGQDFGSALQQIEHTLQRLCKNGDDHGIHAGIHHSSPGHDSPQLGGVRAYIILSSGRKVPQRLSRLEFIRKRYGVPIYRYEQQKEFDGLEGLVRAGL